jgi:hypothetical protein
MCLIGCFMSLNVMYDIGSNMAFIVCGVVCAIGFFAWCVILCDIYSCVLSYCSTNVTG